VKIEPVEELNFDINNVENVKLAYNEDHDMILVIAAPVNEPPMIKHILSGIKLYLFLAICIDMLYMLISGILKKYSLKDKNEKECLEVKNEEKKIQKYF